MRGDRLKKVREERNYSQEKLAELLSIGALQIWRYENGETEPKGEMLAKIAKFLNVSADYLLGLTDNPHGYLENDLSPQEKTVISLWRKGKKLEAVNLISSE